MDLSPQLIVGEPAMSGFLPNRHLTSQRSSKLETLIANHATSATDDERRKYARAQMPIPLTVVPLEGHFQPVNCAYAAESIDISTHGISFVVQCDTGASFWLVDFGSCIVPGFQAVVKTVRMEPLGESNWKVAGPFATDADIS